CANHRPRDYRDSGLLADRQILPYAPPRRDLGGIGMIGWIVLGVVVLLLLMAIGLYNRLVRLRALVKEGFSGITVQLRRRADLVPNLVSTVQGYAAHERETLDAVTAQRTAATSAGCAAARASRRTQCGKRCLRRRGRRRDDGDAWPIDRGRRSLSRPQGRRQLP